MKHEAVKCLYGEGHTRVRSCAMRRRHRACTVHQGHRRTQHVPNNLHIRGKATESLHISRLIPHPGGLASDGCKPRGGKCEGNAVTPASTGLGLGPVRL